MNGDKWRLTDEYKRINGHGKDKKYLSRVFVEKNRKDDIVDLVGFGRVHAYWLDKVHIENKKRIEYNRRLHRFDLRVYPCEIWVAIDCPDDFLTEKFKEPIIPLGDLAAYVCNISGGLLMRFRNVSCMSVRYIAHESTHAALEVFEKIGYKLDYNNQEPLAFLIDYISDFCDKAKNKTTGFSNKPKKK